MFRSKFSIYQNQNHRDESGEIESIYNLVPKAPEVLIKPKRYSSVYSDKVRDEVKRCKSAHRTFGFSKTPLSPPNEFLKKNSLRYSLPSSATKSRRFCHLETRRPSLPPNKQRPGTCGAQRNFVYENAHKTISNSSKSNSVNNFNHSSSSREYLGNIPKYKNKKDYGTVPKYIYQFVEEMKKKREEEENKENLDKLSLRKLTEEERNNLLQGLKHNLGNLQCQYLNLSVIIDTPSKRNRKMYLESQINQLERDINMLERHQNIMIMNMDR